MTLYDNMIKEHSNCSDELVRKTLIKNRSHEFNQKLSSALDHLDNRYRYKSEQQLQEKINHLEAKIAAWDDIESAKQSPVLKNPQSSRLHNLMTALRHNQVRNLNDKDCEAFFELAPSLQQCSIFLISHDWASAFQSSSEDFENHEVQIPFPFCCFELQISNVRVCVITVNRDDNNFETTDMIIFCGTKAGWVITTFLNLNENDHKDVLLEEWQQETKDFSDHAAPLNYIAVCQIKAVCIAMESEIAETEIIRAPHKLNKKREKHGKVPISDYHVINLARRHRSERPATSGTKKASPRLHFRRGHWRHFDNHKTWVKWTLVGEPDLGFIDKHYKL